jgi:hypothetical protein
MADPRGILFLLEALLLRVWDSLSGSASGGDASVQHRFAEIPR